MHKWKEYNNIEFLTSRQWASETYLQHFKRFWCVRCKCGTSVKSLTFLCIVLTVNNGLEMRPIYDITIRFICHVGGKNTVSNELDKKLRSTWQKTIRRWIWEPLLSSKDFSLPFFSLRYNGYRFTWINHAHSTQDGKFFVEEAILIIKNMHELFVKLMHKTAVKHSLGVSPKFFEQTNKTSLNLIKQINSKHN